MSPGAGFFCAAAIVTTAAFAVAAITVLPAAAADSVVAPVVPAAFTVTAGIVVANAAAAASHHASTCIFHCQDTFCLFFLQVLAVAEQIRLVSTAPSTILNSYLWLQLILRHMSQTFEV